MPSDKLADLAIDKTRQLHPAKRGSTWLRSAIIVVLLIAGTSALIIYVTSRAVKVETTTTVSNFFPTQSFTLLNSSGYVVAQRKAAVASKTTGRIEWIGVEEGSRVRGGDVIARLENKDIEATVRQAEAALQNAKATREQTRAELVDAEKSLQRNKELLKQGIVSQAEYDTSEARANRAAAAMSGSEAGIRGAAATLQGAQVNLSYSLIRAPFDAVVLTKNADVGDIITPLGAAANSKAAVVTIADLASLQVEADVSESSLSQVRKGQPCEITLDALPGSRFRGVVHAVVPTADRSKASIMVKIRFLEQDQRIFPEMSAKVAFLEREALAEDRKPRLAVDPAAIVTQGGRTGVYLVKGEQVLFTTVHRGAKLGDLVEVSGLRSGDKLAVRPLDKLKDGARISLPEKK
ncbi:MAG TPA: efflux RND transporter periplasmic adaptor subunit [Desulfuromonadales bacterium]|nr:efflux RND transporter periplasmic adaptor subunit [Desulfuromonadales bacterium]